MLRRFQPKAVPASKAPFSQVVMDDRYAFLSGLVAADFPAGRAGCLATSVQKPVRCSLQSATY